MSKSHRRPPTLRRRLARLSRPVRYTLLRTLLDGFRLFAQALPHGWALALGRALGRVAALVDARGRQRAERQLEAAGIGETPQARHALIRQVYDGLGMNVVEWLHSLRWTREQIQNAVHFDGMASVQAALDRGRGLVFVSAHMGNWELLPRVYLAASGQIMAAVMAETPDPLITEWMIRWREDGGQSRIIPANEALSILRYLRRGGAVALLADQDSTRSRGIFVDFFGRPAYTPMGPAHLARLLGAPLILGAIVREADDPCRHRVLMAEPILPNPELDEEADIQRITQEYTSILEGWIRRDPGQWVWIHERWRHQPGQKIRLRYGTRKKKEERSVKSEK